jgi:hypothetical protein
LSAANLRHFFPQPELLIEIEPDQHPAGIVFKPRLRNFHEVTGVILAVFGHQSRIIFAHGKGRHLFGDAFGGRRFPVGARFALAKFQPARRKVISARASVEYLGVALAGSEKKSDAIMGPGHNQLGVARHQSLQHRAANAIADEYRIVPARRDGIHPRLQIRMAQFRLVMMAHRQEFQVDHMGGLRRHQTNFPASHFAGDDFEVHNMLNLNGLITNP